MRAIENKIIDVMNNRKSGHFQVSVRDKVWNSVCNSFYFLWNNNVYTKLNDYKSVVERFSLCGWDTPTTRSRLNALLTLGKIQKRNGKLYYIYGNNNRIMINKDDTYFVREEGYLIR